jgi:replicative DNA helicase
MNRTHLKASGQNSAAAYAMRDGHETVVLARMMDAPSAMGQRDLSLTAEIFTGPNRAIYSAIVALNGNRSLLAVQDELERRGQLQSIGGPARLTEIFNRPTDDANFEYALSEVLDACRPTGACQPSAA